MTLNGVQAAKAIMVRSSHISLFRSTEAKGQGVASNDIAFAM